MTVTRQDVQAVSSGPQPGGVPLPADQLDRIAAVLNRHSTHRPAPSPTDRPLTERNPPSFSEPPAGRAAIDGTKIEATPPPAPRPAAWSHSRQQVLDVMRRAGYRPEQIQEASGLLPEHVDSQHEGVVLTRFGLTAGELMDRMGSSP